MILRRDFEEVRAIFRDQRLDQGADVSLEEKCSDLMILFHLQIARINGKQQRAQQVVEKTKFKHMLIAYGQSIVT